MDKFHCRIHPQRETMIPKGIIEGVQVYYCKYCNAQFYIANSLNSEVIKIESTKRKKKKKKVIKKIITIYPFIPLKEERLDNVANKPAKQAGKEMSMQKKPALKTAAKQIAPKDTLVQKSEKDSNKEASQSSSGQPKANNKTTQTTVSMNNQYAFSPTRILPRKEIARTSKLMKSQFASTQPLPSQSNNTEDIWMRKPFPNSPVVNCISDKTISIFVSKGRLRCQRGQHKVQNINAIVQSRKNITTTIPIQRCLTCQPNFYFVDYEVLQNREADVGRLIFSKLESAPETALGDYDITPEHILHSLGYNVNQNNGMSAKMRQNLLRRIIENGTLSKFAIMDHLEQLLRINKRNPNMTLARVKWKEDLDFLAEWSDSKQVINGLLTRDPRRK